MLKKELIEEIGVREATAEELLDFIGITGSITEILSQLKAKNIQNERFEQGLTELEAVCTNIKSIWC